MFRDQKIEMEPRDYVNPSKYDVLLSDVKHDDLIGPISERLETTYLEEQRDIQYDPKKGIPGILYGTNARPMINLVISSTKYKKPINIIFLVDTGSPCLYICETAMKALGFNENIPQTFLIEVGGIDGTYEAVMSPLITDGKDGHYKDINLLGATFLLQADATVTLNYKAKFCQLLTEKVTTKYA